MTDTGGESRALKPLWGLTLGGAAGCGLALAPREICPNWIPILMVAAGFFLFAVAVRRGIDAPVALWLAAGFALVGSHGFHDSEIRL